MAEKEYRHTVEIKEYKRWLIVTVLDYGFKIREVGTGLLFSNFNRLDLKISDEAMAIIRDNLNANLEKKEPVLEIIATDRIWWASRQGIIIPPGEIYHIYTMPLFTKCENAVDEKIKTIIDAK
jgi:hypothetical protein